MVDFIKPHINTSKLISELKLKVSSSEKDLRHHHEKAVGFLEKMGVTPKNIREHAAKIATGTALSGLMLFSSPAVASHLPLSISKYASYNPHDLQNLVGQKITEILPQDDLKLSNDVETKISQIVKDIFDINITPSINSERLNHSYGFIGAEQHLPRFPGDNIGLHDEYQVSGITPGRGAWGYFANSQENLTDDLIKKEKYYVAVQTLYLPDWNIRTKYLVDFYKYRKVAVINPVNGKIMICVIADSGPSNSTGKQFGGSPEVMAYLNLKDGSQKGKVVLFFVDDPENKVPLGQLEYNWK